MNADRNYSVQIITDVDQLTEALKLRYSIYRNVYPKLLEGCINECESDEFDRRCIHLGLYCENVFGKKLIGYCRLVIRPSDVTSLSEYLLASHPEYRTTTGNQAPRLPMLKRMQRMNTEVLNSFCQNLEMNNIRYAETSRFMIDDQHRGIATCSFFVTSMFAIASAINLGYVFFECQPHHAAFYKKYGLTLFPGITPCMDSVLEAKLVIFGTDLNTSSLMVTRTKPFIQQLKEDKKIILKAA